MAFSPINLIVTPLIFDRFFKPKKKAGKEKTLTIEEAHTRAKEIILEAKDEALKIRTQAEEEAQRIRQEGYDLKERVGAYEKKWQSRSEELRSEKEALDNKKADLQEQRQQLVKLEDQKLKALEAVATLTHEEAKKEYMKALDKELAEEAAKRIKENEEKIRDESHEKAKELLITAMQRIGTEYVPVASTSEVKLPSEDLKGRIIGREGRNIKAFEAAAGVGVEISDEERVVVVSSFDPVRREIAKVALERLVTDGRIQPARIEEVVEKTKDEIYQIIHKTGEDLTYKAKVYNLPREIIDLLGKFKYRTSYGQSMWTHTLEVVHLGEALAAELSARVELVRKACLLHDIGKAVTTETDKGHAEIGAQICRRNGIDEEVVRTFEGHHTGDFPNLEAIIVYLADAISGARPGARREDYEAYIQRIKELESVALSFAGVEKAFALSAGREVRVIVKPADISDAQMVKLAHDISHKIRNQLQNFPGPIKVNVIREIRTSAVAKPKNE